MKPEFSRMEVAGTLISDYVFHKPQGAPKQVIFLLHGYQQTGAYLFKKLEASFPENALVISPNGPFPVPTLKKDGSRRIGFSWYFYDFSTDSYFIDMKVSIELIEGFVQRLGLVDLPKRIVGFSQGGYLAPFVAARLQNVRQVVGVAAEFLGQELRESIELREPGAAWPPAFRVDAIHGEQDDVVKPGRSRQLHAEALEQGIQGEWVGLPGVGHKITTHVNQVLGEMLTRDSTKR
ncbi:hypothetical protein WDW37_02350 [Bdellovibrionota bacterium FG-1]